MASGFARTISDVRERGAVVRGTSGGVTGHGHGSTESSPTDVASIQWVTCDLYEWMDDGLFGVQKLFALALGAGIGRTSGHP